MYVNDKLKESIKSLSSRAKSYEDLKYIIYIVRDVYLGNILLFLMDDDSGQEAKNIYIKLTNEPLLTKNNELLKIFNEEIFIRSIDRAR